MNIFWFQRNNNHELIELSEQLERSGFSGVLLTYSFFNDDQFVKIANIIDKNKKLKYIVAIRPYTISAQYLSMIANSFKKISKDRIVINIVTGWVYDEEKNIGGVQGDVNDLSSNVERSNYLLEYVKNLKNIKGNIPDFYVSVTNQTVFNGVSGDKVIIPYSRYKEKEFEIIEENTMISIFPIIRKTKEELSLLKETVVQQDVEYFTFEEFELFLNDLDSKKIESILIGEYSHMSEEEEIILPFIKNYVDSKQ